GESLMTRAVARGDIDLCAACARHLYAHMTCRAEAVDAEPCAPPTCAFKSGQTQRPIADDARTQKRRSLQIVEAFRQTIDKTCGRDRVFSITARHSSTRKLRTLAQVLAAHTTETTDAA